MSENKAERHPLGKGGAQMIGQQQHDETIVMPGDVCVFCGTFTSPWRCCCEKTRTTAPRDVLADLDLEAVALRGLRNQRELYASGWTVPGAVA